MTGPNADNQTILGDWAGKQPDENVITIVEGLKDIGDSFEIDFLDVGSNPRHVTHSDIDEASDRAADADVAIVVVGENSFRWEWNEKTNGENSARASVGLAGLQTELVKAVFSTGTPVILVVVGGRPLALDWISDSIPAIIYAWEPGSFGGEAVASVITGSINPSGKLPVTLPRSAGHILSVYNHKPTHYFHSYVTEKTEPLLPFVH